MLILTRRTEESILIGDDITLTILSVKGNQVRIGIEAPKEISVHREETYKRIVSENNDRPKELEDEEKAMRDGYSDYLKVMNVR